MADEVCDNGIDDDMDGAIDCADTDCNGSGLCTAEASCATLGDNLIINGDFEQGYFGFTSDYGRGSNNQVTNACGGYYLVGNSTDLFANYEGESAAPGSYTSPDPTDVSNTATTPGNIPDQTSGTGNFLFFNPTNQVGSAVWYQDVNLCAGQRYVVSVWVGNKANNGLTNVSFSLDGDLLFPYKEIQGAAWQEVTAVFEAKVSGISRISIVNAAECGGYDSMLDGISLRACGAQELEISGDAAVCSGEDLTLSVLQGPTDPTTEYLWQKSEDGGTSWINIPGAFYREYVHPNLSIPTQFRLLMSGAGNIINPSCRVASNVFQPALLNCVAEICNNGLDDDGDGLIDEADADCPIAGTIACEQEGGITYYMPSVSRNDLLGYPHNLFISTSFPVANINIRTADSSFNQNVVIEAETPFELNLPNDLVASAQINTVENNRGLIITSDVPIIPVYRVVRGNNRMLAIMKGKGALGRSFRLASPVRSRGFEGRKEWHFFSFIASEDNTEVTIDDSPFPLRGITLPHTVTLNAGETFLAIPELAEHHITGTLVSSDKPISVMVGTQHTAAFGDGSREGCGDIIIPFNKLGQDYVCLRGGSPDANNDYAMVVAVLDGTQVFLDGNPVPVATLQAGEFTDIEITGEKGTPHHIHTSKEAYVYHVSSNFPTRSGEFGMAILPPASFASCKGIKSISIPKFANSTNDLTVIAPDNALATLTIDGQPYSNFGVAKPVPGYQGFSTLYINQNTLPNPISTIKSGEYFFAGQLVATGGTGAYGYYSEYEARVDILDPVQLLPTTYYIADTVCLGSSTTHSLVAESCGSLHSIISGVQGSGGVTFSSNSLAITYTAEEVGLDVLQISVENEDGFRGTVCIGFYVVEAEADAGPDLTLCEGETTQLNGAGGLSFTWSPAAGLSATDIPNPTFTPVNTQDLALTVTDQYGCQHTDSVKLTVTPRPELTPAIPRLCEDDSRSIDLALYNEVVNLSGSVGQFAYFDEQWNPIMNPATFEAIDGRLVNLIFMDGNTGCLDSTTLTFDIQPTIVIPTDVIEVCPEHAASVDLTVYEAGISVPGGVFTYTDENGNIIPNPKSLSVTDGQVIQVNYVSNLCQANATYTIMYRTPPPVFAGNDTTICFGTQIALQGRGATSLSWESHESLSDTSVANPTVRPVGETIYRLTGVDEFGCTATDEIAIDQFPVVEAIVIFEPEICQGDSVQLFASGGTTYSWNNEQSLTDPTIEDPIAFPGITTGYTVKVTDANGCGKSNSFEIVVNPKPKADAGEDQAICLGETVRLIGGRGSAYSWFPEIGLSGSTESSPVFSGETTTEYILTVTNEEGCTDADTVMVTVNPLPLTSAEVSETEICKDDPVLFEASGADTYSWTPAFDFQDPTSPRTVIVPSASSMYVVEGRTNAGCITRDSVFILIQGGPNALVNPDSSICSGDAMQLGVSGAVSYLWNTFQDEDTLDIAPLVDTDYWVIPFSELGCPGDTSYVSIRSVPYPIAMFSPDADSGFVPKEIVFTNESMNADSYEWEFGDGENSEEENPIYTYRESGQFEVRLRAYNELGCMDSTTFSFMDMIRSQVFTPNAFTPDNDGLNDVFQFNGLGVERMTLQVFNRWGNLIYENTGAMPFWDGTIEGVPQAKGVYIYKLDVTEVTGYTYQKMGAITLIR